MAKKKTRGNGEGTVYKRPDGTYTCQITVGRKPDGSLDRKTIYAKTKSEALQKRDAIINELRNGTFVREDKITIADWLDFWLKEYKTPPNIKLATYISYETFIRVHVKPNLGSIYLKSLRPDHLQKLYNSKLKDGRADGKEGGISIKTLRNLHNMIHQALEQALKCGFIVRNVSEATSIPKIPKTEIRILSVEEMTIFLKAIQKERNCIAFLLSLFSGLRLGELLGLTWDNVDLENGILKVRKTLSRLKTFKENSPRKTELIMQDAPKTTYSRRNVPIPDSILLELKKHREKQSDEGLENPHNLVIISEVGTPFEPMNMIRILHRIIRECGMPHLNVHALRHTFATRLLEENERPKVVQEMLGHANISMTMDTYSHVMPELKKSAADKLNHFFEKSMN